MSRLVVSKEASTAVAELYHWPPSSCTSSTAAFDAGGLYYSTVSWRSWPLLSVDLPEPAAAIMIEGRNHLCRTASQRSTEAKFCSER